MFGCLINTPMANFKSASNNTYVTEALSQIFPDLRTQIEEKKQQQKQEGRFAQPEAQQELADIIKQELSKKKPVLHGNLAMYHLGCESVLAKLQRDRERLMDKHMQENYDGYNKKRLLTLRFQLPDGKRLTQPDIVVEDFIRETQALQYISNHRQQTLPGTLLNNKELRKQAKLTLVLNKTLYTPKAKHEPIMEMWARGKLLGERQIIKKGLYLTGCREHLANDDIGTKLVFNSLADWYKAIGRQVRSLKQDHELQQAIDIKGKLPSGEPLPKEYNRTQLLAAEDNAKKLNQFYLKNPKQQISDLHKDQMMLMWTFDHKYLHFPVESQYIHRTAHDILEHGCLAHKENYEHKRREDELHECELQGTHLVMPQIYDAIQQFFVYDEIKLANLPARTK